jgi:hypothetical protein
MEALAKAFENAHGFRFKLSFAETLVQLLHPVAKVSVPFWLLNIILAEPN